MRKLLVAVLVALSLLMAGCKPRPTYQPFPNSPFAEYVRHRLEWREPDLIPRFDKELRGK